MARGARRNADRHRTLTRRGLALTATLAALAACAPSSTVWRGDAGAAAALRAANVMRADAGAPALALAPALSAAARRLAGREPTADAGRAAVFAEGYAAFELISGFVSGAQPLDADAAMRRAFANGGDLRLDPSARDFGVFQDQGGRRWTYVVATPIAPLAADVADAVLRAVNRERAAQGLGALRRDAQLDAAAAGHAAFLVARSAQAATRTEARRLQHEGADGSGPRDRAIDAGYAVGLIAENLAQTTDADAANAVRLWIDSPPHRRNMLTPDAVDAGIAVVEAATGDAAEPVRRWWVMLYAGPWGASRRGGA